MTADLQCFGSNYKPQESPPHDEVRRAVETIKAHLNAEWISDGCKADHSFGCASCQAVMLERELDGIVAWLEEIPTPAQKEEK